MRERSPGLSVFIPDPELTPTLTLTQSPTPLVMISSQKMATDPSHACPHHPCDPDHEAPRTMTKIIKSLQRFYS